MTSTTLRQNKTLEKSKIWITQEKEAYTMDNTLAGVIKTKYITYRACEKVVWSSIGNIALCCLLMFCFQFVFSLSKL